MCTCNRIPSIVGNKARAVAVVGLDIPIRHDLYTIGLSLFSIHPTVVGCRHRCVVAIPLELKSVAPFDAQTVAAATTTIATHCRLYWYAVDFCAPIAHTTNSVTYIVLKRPMNSLE